ncbi:hypothetical protein O181_095878 [Austropuccinia psidii MF-1]|uniref:DDE Tnp4 domain-containing protein n=1 Tax=Austropuccinia psidii MF-1 TaxID=1389203 RepID=A0A9Q3J4P9_9BASI|nr:hypothetical protein [Austropuccinia psidii MF-1]
MPRYSARQEFIHELNKTRNKAKKQLVLSWLRILLAPEWPTIGTMLGSNCRLTALMLEWLFSQHLRVEAMLHRALSSRYFILRRPQMPREEFNLMELMTMREIDFKQAVRTSHRGFHHIYSLIKQSPEFTNNSYCGQLDVCQQLALTLERLGSNGNGASLGRFARTYQVSRGSIVMASRRVIKVLCDLGPQYIFWPNEEQRGEISRHLAHEGFPGCVGFLDGTTIPLFQRPGVDGEVFYDRKKRYSLNVQVACDHRKMITAILSGWPGSCGDSTMYKRMGLFEWPQDFFGWGQYILTDSAYPLGLHCIPCYKGSAANHNLNQSFNYYIAQSRVRIEHCLGVWKGRWGSLQNLRLACNKASDMIHINNWIYVCAVLHNILLEDGDNWHEEHGNENVFERQGVDRLEGNVPRAHRAHIQDHCLRFHGQI